MKRDPMTLELERFLPGSKKWLLDRGYIVRTDAEEPEYSWTPAGYEWINEHRGTSNQESE